MKRMTESRSNCKCHHIHSQLYVKHNQYINKIYVSCRNPLFLPRLIYKNKKGNTRYVPFSLFVFYNFNSNVSRCRIDPIPGRQTSSSFSRDKEISVSTSDGRLRTPNNNTFPPIAQMTRGMHGNRKVVYVCNCSCS